MSSKDQQSQSVEPRVIITRKLQWEQKNPDAYYKFRLTNSGDLHNIHFSCRGPKDTIFEGGIYHGKLILPAAFPFKPPDLLMITPSGRFETNKKICFSYTSYHPETWSPALKFKDIILGFLSLFNESSENAIGMITTLDKSAIMQYKESNKKFTCAECGMCHSTLLKELEQLEKGGT